VIRPKAQEDVELSYNTVTLPITDVKTMRLSYSWDFSDNWTDFPPHDFACDIQDCTHINVELIVLPRRDANTRPVKVVFSSLIETQVVESNPLHVYKDTDTYGLL
jgi:hypothetical protein